jgi:two-component system, chemotaxis family, protein-glutamate methylesterase/glutaminase
VVRSLLQRDIVVIGASAGGLKPARRLLSALPSDFPASIFLTLHTSAQAPGLLAEILDAAGPLLARFPSDGEIIQEGRVYVAPVDHHMLVDPGKVVVVRGPKENRFRPAIDPLFRSAAVHYGPRVIGVILSGMLDDGAAGLVAVRQCGGVAIVQDPREAEFPDMILNAQAAAAPQHCVPVAEMASLIAKLVKENVKMPTDESTTAARLRIEADLAAMRGGGNKRELSKLGKLSTLVCPECNGALWEMEDAHILRYRCHIGHAYAAESLAADQTDALERALGIALRTLEDTASLSRRLAAEAQQHRRTRSHLLFLQRSEEAESNAEIIRNVLQKQKPIISGNGPTDPSQLSA